MLIISGFKNYFRIVLIVSNMQNILILDDNFTTTRQISEMLPPDRYFTSVAHNIAQARQFLDRYKYHLVILDRCLPDGDGIQIVEDLYWSHREVAILVLSDLGRVEERIRLLRKGADEYVTKPFSMDELILRVEKLLSKIKQVDSHALHAGSLSVFPQSGTICVKDSIIQLRKKEADILSFLIRHKNRVVSKDMLVENIWSNERPPQDQTISVYVRRIRMRLGKASMQLKCIRGYGFILSDG